MFEIIQSLYYFRHFKQDDWKFKVLPSPLQYSLPLTQFLLQTLVTVAVLVDTLSTIGDYICVYLVRDRLYTQGNS
jgi:hypothetical protein